MRILTFTWSISIEADDNFDENNREQLDEALRDAWQQVQMNECELTDNQSGEDEVPAPQSPDPQEP